jgi:hypothetical protein
MIQPKNNKLLFVIPVLVAVLSMILFWMGLVNGWFGPPGAVASEFCEASRPGLIKQPVNTWSNIGFIISGLTIGWLLMRGTFSRNQNNITQNPFYGIFYASLVVLLGPGSMCMHATTAEIGGFFDMLSMYLIASFTVAYATERFFGLKPIYFIAIFILILAICIWADGAPYHIIFWFFGDTVFAFFISLTIFIEALNGYVRKMQHDKRWVAGALGMLLLAFFIWNITRTGTSLCHPYSLFQGHAAWHILDAVSTFCLFMFYASEHKEKHQASMA